QKRFRFTQEQIAQNLHISRSRIANTLRLLSLPPRVQAALSEQKITEGHAKIIAGLPDQEAQEKLLNTILKHTLNVRDTESLVKTSPQSYTKGVNERVKNLANQMSERLNSKVEIRPRKDRYVVTLNVSSEDDLESLAQKLNI
ncbi:MAG: ParB/RepB/Spo0J family partition protein, partial [Candidatus Paceibacteria bacterium]